MPRIKKTPISAPKKGDHAKARLKKPPTPPKRRRHRYSSNQIEDVCRMLAKGSFLKTIAQATGVGKETINDISADWNALEKDAVTPDKVRPAVLKAYVEYCIERAVREDNDRMALNIIKVFYPISQKVPKEELSRLFAGAGWSATAIAELLKIPEEKVLPMANKGLLRLRSGIKPTSPRRTPSS